MKVMGTSSEYIKLMDEAIRRLHEQYEPRIRFFARVMLRDPNWGLDLAMRKVNERRTTSLPDTSPRWSTRCVMPC